MRVCMGVLVFLVMVGQPAHGATVRGSVNGGGDRVSALAVDLLNQEGKAVGFARCGDDGRFVFSDVAPGSYFVALHLPFPLEPDDPVLTFRMPTPVPAVVRTDDRVVEVTLALEPGVDLQGRVLDHEGNPLGGIIIGVREKQNYLVRTDNDGRFHYRGLPPEATVRVGAFEGITPGQDESEQYGHERLVMVRTGSVGEPPEDVGDIAFFPVPDEPNLLATFVDEHGELLAGTRPIVAIRTDGLVRKVLVSVEGRIAERVPEGEYIVYADRHGHQEVKQVRIAEGEVAEIEIRRRRMDE